MGTKKPFSLISHDFSLVIISPNKHWRKLVWRIWGLPPV